MEFQGSTNIVGTLKSVNKYLLLKLDPQTVFFDKRTEFYLTDAENSSF